LINNSENAVARFGTPTGSSFPLMADSLANDSGAVVPVSTDHEGRARPQGGGYDIGAYEYSSSGISSLPNIGLPSVAFNPIRVSGNSEPFRLTALFDLLFPFGDRRPTDSHDPRD